MKLATITSEQGYDETMTNTKSLVLPPVIMAFEGLNSSLDCRVIPIIYRKYLA